MFDVEGLLAPVSDDAPSGPLLEYDGAFLALHEAAAGKPEQRMGASVIPAAPPDWRKVEKEATALFARTKDLRVAILWAKARLRTAGLDGFFDGAALIRLLLERFWDTVHPQLDPSDGNDPVMRVNALSAIVDVETVLNPLREAEVAGARAVGRIAVRDLDPAARQAPPPAADGDAAKAAPKPPPVDAVLAACDQAALAKLAERATAAAADLRAMDAVLADKAGGERVQNLGRLTAIVELVAKTLAEHLAKTSGASGQAPADAGGGDAMANGAGGAAPAGVSPGGVNSRGDVLVALEAICTYYERAEPSSPIPLLLKRARRLVDLGFLDIVRDLVPDAVPQVEALRGKEE